MTDPEGDQMPNVENIIHHAGVVATLVTTGAGDHETT